MNENIKKSMKNIKNFKEERNDPSFDSVKHEDACAVNNMIKGCVGSRERKKWKELNVFNDSLNVSCKFYDEKKANISININSLTDVCNMTQFMKMVRAHQYLFPQYIHWKMVFRFYRFVNTGPDLDGMYTCSVYSKGPNEPKIVDVMDVIDISTDPDEVEYQRKKDEERKLDEIDDDEIIPLDRKPLVRVGYPSDVGVDFLVIEKKMDVSLNAKDRSEDDGNCSDASFSSSSDNNNNNNFGYGKKRIIRDYLVQNGDVRVVASYLDKKRFNYDKFDKNKHDYVFCHDRHYVMIFEKDSLSDNPCRDALIGCAMTSMATYVANRTNRPVYDVLHCLGHE